MNMSNCMEVSSSMNIINYERFILGICLCVSGGFLSPKSAGEPGKVQTLESYS